MATYQFKAFAENGLQESGKIDSQNRTEAFQQLIARKLRPLTLEKVTTAVEAQTTISKRTYSKLSHEALLSFTEELVQLLEAGLPLERALHIIEQRKEKSPLLAIAAFLRQQIREGKRFSIALRNTGTAFSELYCHMVAAGEASGALPQILKRQSQHLALLLELRRRIATALVYPSIVFAAGLVLLLIFMTFLLPQLTMLLSKSDQSLPFMTRSLVATSKFLSHYWWALAGLGIVTISSLKIWKKAPQGQKIWDRSILRFPLLGQILRIHFLAEFLQTLSTLVSSYHKVGEGRAFSRALRQSTFFPAVLADIIAVGEETGNLSGALERAATRYDRELTMRIQRITALIQPLTILIVALFVGIVAYSMIAGILSSLSGLRIH